MTAGKYGENYKYGQNIKYGDGTADEGGEVTWILLVDWDEDGSLDSTNEAAVGRMQDLEAPFGTEHYINSRGDGFSEQRGNQINIILEDKDRRYDSRNTSSPLYPNVAPGKNMYLGVMDNATLTRYDVLQGVIADIRPLSGAGGGGKVRLVIDNYQQQIDRAECTSTASELLKNLDDAIKIVLADIGYKKTIVIDSDSQPVPMLAISDQNAGQALNQLAHAGLGYFFVDRYGTARFYDRDHTGHTNHNIDESQVLKEILVTQPWDNVYNQAQVIVHRPIWKQPSVVYALPNPEAINSGTPITINVRCKLSKNVQIDKIKANTLQDGNGTDISDDITIDSQDLGKSGGSVTLSTTSNGYITRFEVRGRMLAEIKEDSVHEDTTHSAKAGIKKFKLDSPFMQDPHYAVVFSEVLKDFLNDVRDSVTIQIEQRPSLQFALDIMHKVTFTSSALDYSSEVFYISGYQHQFGIDTGQKVVTTVWMHKIVTDNTAITASLIAEENAVPLGLEDPSGDPDTIMPDWDTGDDPITDGWTDENGDGVGGVVVFDEGVRVGQAGILDFQGVDVQAYISTPGHAIIAHGGSLVSTGTYNCRVVYTNTGEGIASSAAFKRTGQKFAAWTPLTDNGGWFGDPSQTFTFPAAGSYNVQIILRTLVASIAIVDPDPEDGDYLAAKTNIYWYGRHKSGDTFYFKNEVCAYPFYFPEDILELDFTALAGLGTEVNFVLSGTGGFDSVTIDISVNSKF